MFLNFAAVLATLGADAAIRVANAARPAGDYLFAQLLPERNVPTYDVRSGNMTVRSIMAGLAAMDSPYPPGGVVELSSFLENTAKLANEATLPEQALRHMQDTLLRLGIVGTAAANERLVEESLNFLQKVIVQPHLDAMEWLRGEALVTGAIAWQFGNIELAVDYGVPLANMLPARAGNDAYGGSASKFWDDVRLLRRTLRGNVRAIIAHPDTIDVIRYNAVNAVAAVEESAGGVTFRRLNSQGGFTQDTGDTVRIIAYDREGEIINPADPSTTIIVPFMPAGKLLAVGNNTRSGYRVGQGSTEDPDDANSLGYTHIGPTVEGGGRPGRWSRLYTPEARPWSLKGQGVTNGLPVIEAPEKIAVATTAMP